MAQYWFGDDFGIEVRLLETLPKKLEPVFECFDMRSFYSCLDWNVSLKGKVLSKHGEQCSTPTFKSLSGLVASLVLPG